MKGSIHMERRNTDYITPENRLEAFEDCYVECIDPVLAEENPEIRREHNANRYANLLEDEIPLAIPPFGPRWGN